MFARAYKKGKSVVTSHAVLYFLPRKNGSGLTLGITVSKKLGGAVQRNRVKRLVRESVRTALTEEVRLTDGALIVVARTRAFAKGLKMQQFRRVLKAGLSELSLS